MENKIYILYKTTNIINGKFYVGIHKQNPKVPPYEFDGYLGSGKILIDSLKKYGKNNFVRETLSIFESKSEAEKAEKLMVDRLFLENKDVYNLIEGGGCPPYHPTLWTGKKHKDITKIKISLNRSGKAMGNKHWTKDPSKRQSYNLMIEKNSMKAIEFNKTFKPALGHKKTNDVKLHLSNLNKQLKWYKNLITGQCVFAKQCPEGFVPGRIFNKNIGE